MRRLALFLAGFGLARLFFWRRPETQQQLPPPAAPEESDPRAEALRARLAEAREVVDERDEFEAAETPVDQVEPLEDPDTRRRAVHEAARETAERMRKRG